MTSTPITSSNPQSSARSAPPPCSDPSANAISATQTNGVPDVQSIDPFGALLAQQMGEAGASALIAPPSAIAPSPAIAIDTETTADPANLTVKGDPDKMPETIGIPNDTAGALIAMLQLPQEIKTPVIKDATGNATAAAHTMAAGKASIYRPTASIDAAQARAESDMATADNQVARSASGLGMANSAALTNNLPGTPLSTQNVAPLIASIAASAVMPNMPFNNSPLGTPPSGTRQTITAPLGSNGWADEFSQKIRWISTQQNQVAELHLNPPDLGPLDVVLKISDNQATVLFTSPHSAVRDAIENALPKLRETLADNGITLGNTTVSDQPPRDRGAERPIGQGSGAAAQRDGSGEAPGSEGLLTAGAQIASARRHNGMVDIFA